MPALQAGLKILATSISFRRFPPNQGIKSPWTVRFIPTTWTLLRVVLESSTEDEENTPGWHCFRVDVRPEDVRAVPNSATIINISSVPQAVHARSRMCAPCLRAVEALGRFPAPHEDHAGEDKLGLNDHESGHDEQVRSHLHASLTDCVLSAISKISPRVAAQASQAPTNLRHDLVGSGGMPDCLSVETRPTMKPRCLKTKADG